MSYVLHAAFGKDHLSQVLEQQAEFSWLYPGYTVLDEDEDGMTYIDDHGLWWTGYGAVKERPVHAFHDIPLGLM